MRKRWQQEGLHAWTAVELAQYASVDGMVRGRCEVELLCSYEQRPQKEVAWVDEVEKGTRSPPYAEPPRVERIIESNDAAWRQVGGSPA